MSHSCDGPSFCPRALRILFVDGMVVSGLRSLGVKDLSPFWITGKMTGHFVMGLGALVAGARIAPTHGGVVPPALLGLMVAAAIAAVASGGLPTRVMLPLSLAFVLGGALGVRTVGPRAAGGTSDGA